MPQKVNHLLGHFLYQEKYYYVFKLECVMLFPILSYQLKILIARCYYIEHSLLSTESQYI
ncbi:hypothetical protein SAMN05444396_103399 [Flavobacterium segetis]|uniref:Uncharacterized protein n=1 Tax=Flavobacterium segetis TaxID=271157 RepID=A0A1M5GBC2_9FLAO|nr:hypothetical protein SAMN05444396_103399 [Flavobacterium segetis]